MQQGLGSHELYGPYALELFFMPVILEKGVDMNLWALCY